MKPLLASVCAAGFLLIGALFHSAHAHSYPAELTIIVGQTNVLTVADDGDCSAYVSAAVNEPALVTVTPDSGVGVRVNFEVIAGTNAGQTTITVNWIGSDKLAGTQGPCQEDTTPFGRTVVVKVIPEPEPQSTANDPQPSSASDPVNTWNGELYFIEQPDLDLGGPLPLFFQRYYASRLRIWHVVGDIGDNWRHNFEWRVHWNGNFLVLITERGKVLKYLKKGDNWEPIKSTYNSYQLIQDGQQIIVGDARNGRIYRFNAHGRLAEIHDGRGNTLYLSYDFFTGRLTTVRDHITQSQARILRFFYTGEKLTSVREEYGFTLGRAVQLTYTGDNLTGVQDSGNNSTAYVYDTDHADPGLLKHAVRPRNNIPWRQTYDAVGKVATQTDAYGNVTSFDYGSPYTPGTTIVTDPLGNTTTYHHNTDGSLIGTTDQAGQDASISVNSVKLRNQISSAAGATISRSFHAGTGRVVSETDADGNEVIYTYTPRAHATGVVFEELTRVDYPDGTAQTFTYNASGHLLSHTDQAGHTTSYGYNAFGQVLKETNALGGVITYTYDAFRNKVTMQDASGNTTTYGYDTFKRLNRITHADGSFRTVTYNIHNQPLVKTDERGNTVTRSYDANRNLTTLADLLGGTTTFGYDDMDRLVTVTPSLSNPTSVAYDGLSRIASITGANGNPVTYAYDATGFLVSMSDSLGLVRSNRYDADGNLVESIDALGRSRTFSRDLSGRLRQVALPSGHSISVSYDEMNRVESVTFGGLKTENTLDARGILTEMRAAGGTASAKYELNAFGQITRLTDGNGNDWQVTYDNAGRMISLVDPLGNSTSRTYNNRNWNAGATFPAGLGSATFTYDVTGNLTRAQYSDGTDHHYTNDAAGQVLTSTWIDMSYDSRGRATNSNGMAVEYDSTNRISRISYGPGLAVNYLYDARDRLVRITDWLGGHTDFAYDTVNRLTSITRPNGVQTIYTYDADDNLAGTEERKGLTILATLLLARDAKGQIASATRNHPAAMPPLSLAAATDQFLYDGGSRNTAQTFDALGRLVNDGVRTYQWNSASRLAGYTQGDASVAFSYDGFGNRVQRNDGAQHIQFVWNYALERPAIGIVRQLPGGAIVRRNICMPGGELLYSVLGDGGRQFYHFDELGNTWFITNDDGNVIAAYRYTPQGFMITDWSNGSVNNPFTFQGRFSVMHESGGLYYMRARYYDSAVGRFISPDPVPTLFPQTVNPYQYAGNNPMFYRDPSGEEVTNEDIASASAQTFGTVVSEAAEAAAKKLDRIAQHAGNGPGAAGLQQQAARFRTDPVTGLRGGRAVAALNGVGYGVAAFGGAMEANNLSDRMEAIKRERQRLESVVMRSHRNALEHAWRLCREKHITWEELVVRLRMIDEIYNEAAEIDSYRSKLEVRIESIRSLLRGVGAVTPVPGSAWDGFMDKVGSLPALFTIP